MVLDGCVVEEELECVVERPDAQERQLGKFHKKNREQTKVPYLSYRREYIKYFRCDRRQKSHLSLYPVDDMVLELSLAPDSSGRTGLGGGEGGGGN